MNGPDLRVSKMRPDARLPLRAHPGDAGLDLYALENTVIEPQASAMLRTGVAMAIPDGHVGMISDRSSMAKRGLKIAGGIIDSGYRGEVHIVLWNLGQKIRVNYSRRSSGPAHGCTGGACRAKRSRTLSSRGE